VDLAISVSRDRSAGIIKLDCFKSRFSEEFSMTFRPELRDRGDFVVTDNPEAAPGPTIAEQLWQVIQDNPGRSQTALMTAIGLPEHRMVAFDVSKSHWENLMPYQISRRYATRPAGTPFNVDWSGINTLAARLRAFNVTQATRRCDGATRLRSKGCDISSLASCSHRNEGPVTSTANNGEER
jgi:hypothetical protein